MEWDLLGGDAFLGSHEFKMELAWDELDKEKPITVYPRDTSGEHIEVLCNADFNPPIRLVKTDTERKDLEAYLGLVLDSNAKSLFKLKAEAECTQCPTGTPVMSVTNDDLPQKKGIVLRPRILCPHLGPHKYRFVVALRSLPNQRRGIFTSPFALTVVDRLPEKPSNKPHPLSVSMKSALENPQFADVTFKVEDKEIPAHKVILCSRSEYFKTLLAGHMREASQSHPVVDILDISPELFSHMLKYVYTDQLDIDSENVLNLLSTADRFRLDEMKQRCEKYLEDSVSLDAANVCSILQIADMHMCVGLSQQCTKFISSNLDEMERSSQYVECFDSLLSSFTLIYEDRIRKMVLEGEKREEKKREPFSNQTSPNGSNNSGENNSTSTNNANNTNTATNTAANVANNANSANNANMATNNENTATNNENTANNANAAGNNANAATNNAGGFFVGTNNSTFSIFTHLTNFANTANFGSSANLQGSPPTAKPRFVKLPAFSTDTPKGASKTANRLRLSSANINIPTLNIPPLNVPNNHNVPPLIPTLNVPPPSLPATQSNNINIPNNTVNNTQISELEQMLLNTTTSSPDMSRTANLDFADHAAMDVFQPNADSNDDEDDEMYDGADDEDDFRSLGRIYRDARRAYRDEDLRFLGRMYRDVGRLYRDDDDDEDDENDDSLPGRLGTIFGDRHGRFASRLPSSSRLPSPPRLPSSSHFPSSSSSSRLPSSRSDPLPYFGASSYLSSPHYSDPSNNSNHANNSYVSNPNYVNSTNTYVNTNNNTKLVSNTISSRNTPNGNFNSTNNNNSGRISFSLHTTPTNSSARVNSSLNVNNNNTSSNANSLLDDPRNYGNISNPDYCAKNSLINSLEEISLPTIPPPSSSSTSPSLPTSPVPPSSSASSSLPTSPIPLPASCSSSSPTSPVPPSSSVSSSLPTSPVPLPSSSLPTSPVPPSSSVSSSLPTSPIPLPSSSLPTSPVPSGSDADFDDIFLSENNNLIENNFNNNSNNNNSNSNLNNNSNSNLNNNNLNSNLNSNFNINSNLNNNNFNNISNANINNNNNTNMNNNTFSNNSNINYNNNNNTYNNNMNINNRINNNNNSNTNNNNTINNNNNPINNNNNPINNNNNTINNNNNNTTNNNNNSNSNLNNNNNSNARNNKHGIDRDAFNEYRQHREARQRRFDLFRSRTALLDAATNSNAGSNAASNAISNGLVRLTSPHGFDIGERASSHLTKAISSSKSFVPIKLTTSSPPKQGQPGQQQGAQQGAQQQGQQGAQQQGQQNQQQGQQQQGAQQGQAQGQMTHQQLQQQIQQLQHEVNSLRNSGNTGGNNGGNNGGASNGGNNGTNNAGNSAGNGGGNNGENGGGNGGSNGGSKSPTKDTDAAMADFLVLRKFSGPCSLRLRNDIKEFLLHPIPNIRMYWTTGGGSLTVSVKVVGDSTWGDGWYYFRLLFTSTFPMLPPTVQFVSRLFHPNVYSNGVARIGILEQDNWCPTASVSDIAVAVRNDLFVDHPNEDLLANLYAWHLWRQAKSGASPRFREIVQDLTGFGTNKRASSEGNPDSAKKQKTEDDYDTEELYVSDQSFWMWGDETEREP